MHLREPVDLDAVLLGDHADRSAVLDHERGPVGDRFGSSAIASPTVWCGSSTIGVSKTRWRCLTHDDHVPHHGERDVLRDDRDAAPARDGLGHPSPRDSRHVRDDERERRTRAVGGLQVDVVARGHAGAARHHEDVVVGEVERWAVRSGTAPGHDATGPLRGLEGRQCLVGVHGPCSSREVITLRIVRSRSMTNVARFTGVMYFRFTPSDRATSPDSSDSSG